jgi:hypothetical protein
MGVRASVLTAQPRETVVLAGGGEIPSDSNCVLAAIGQLGSWNLVGRLEFSCARESRGEEDVMK